MTSKDSQGQVQVGQAPREWLASNLIEVGLVYTQFQWGLHHPAGDPLGLWSLFTPGLPLALCTGSL